MYSVNYEGNTVYKYVKITLHFLALDRFVSTTRKSLFGWMPNKIKNVKYKHFI